jgi:hypothetical protein
VKQSSRALQPTEMASACPYSVQLISQIAIVVLGDSSPPTGHRFGDFKRPECGISAHAKVDAVCFFTPKSMAHVFDHEESVISTQFDQSICMGWYTKCVL